MRGIVDIVEPLGQTQRINLRCKQRALRDKEMTRVQAGGQFHFGIQFKALGFTHQRCTPGIGKPQQHVALLSLDQRHRLQFCAVDIGAQEPLQMDIQLAFYRGNVDQAWCMCGEFRVTAEKIRTVVGIQIDNVFSIGDQLCEGLDRTGLDEGGDHAVHVVYLVLHQMIGLGQGQEQDAFVGMLDVRFDRERGIRIGVIDGTGMKVLFFRI